MRKFLLLAVDFISCAAKRAHACKILKKWNENSHSSEKKRKKFLEKKNFFTASFIRSDDDLRTVTKLIDLSTALQHVQASTERRQKNEKCVNVPLNTQKLQFLQRLYCPELRTRRRKRPSDANSEHRKNQVGIAKEFFSTFVFSIC